MGGDAERLVVGFSYSMLAGILSSVFLYIAGLLVMGMLGPEEYGLYQLVFLVPALLSPILNFGIEITLVRFVSKFRVTDPDKAIKTANFLLLIRVIISLTASLIIIILAPWIAGLLGESVTTGVRVAGIFLLGNMLYIFIQSFFQSFFFMKQRTMVMIIHGLAYFAIVPVLIYLDFGYISPILAFSISTYAGFLIGLILIWWKKIRLLPTTSRHDLQITDQLRFATPTYIILLLGSLFAQAGIILIKLAGLEVIQIGFFRGVYNIVAVGSFVAVTLNVVILPYVSELESKKNGETLNYFCSLIIKFLIMFAAPASIGIYLVSQPALSIFLPQYLEAANLMEILSLVLLFSPIFTVAQTMLIGIGKPMLVLRADAVSVISLFIIGGILVFNVGIEGVAYAYVLSMLISTIYSVFMLSRSVGLTLEFRFVFKVALSTLVMAGATFLIMNQISTPVIKLAACIPAGASIYLVMALVLRVMSPEDYRVIRKTLGIARNKAYGRSKKD